MAELAHSLLAVKIVDNDGSALEFAESICTFTDDPIDVKEEGNELKATLKVEGGELQISFRSDSFKLSFSNSKGVAIYEAHSPVKEVQLQHPFLCFKLQNEDSVRAVKEYGTINIEHFAFDLCDFK